MTEQEINDILEGRWTPGQIASFERAHESLFDDLGDIEPMPEDEVIAIEYLFNIYQRLEAKGWRRVSGNSRRDFYRKGKWMCHVPATTFGKVTFTRIK